MAREYIGLSDRAGRRIYVGDIVEYYFRAHPISNDPKDGTYTTSPEFAAANGFTRMLDVVHKHDGTFYFCDVDVEALGGFAWLHAPHCLVVEAPVKAETP